MMINSKSELSESQMLQGMRINFRTATQERWLLPLCCVILLTIFGRNIAEDPADWQNYPFIALALIAVTIPLWRIPLLKRNIRRMPTFGKTVDWSLDERAIEGRGDGFSFSQDWDTIFSATITPDGILIY